MARRPTHPHKATCKELTPSRTIRNTGVPHLSDGFIVAKVGMYTFPSQPLPLQLFFLQASRSARVPHPSRFCEGWECKPFPQPALAFAFALALALVAALALALAFALAVAPRAEGPTQNSLGRRPRSKANPPPRTESPTHPPPTHSALPQHIIQNKQLTPTKLFSSTFQPNSHVKPPNRQIST